MELSVDNRAVFMYALTINVQSNGIPFRPFCGFFLLDYDTQYNFLHYHPEFKEEGVWSGILTVRGFFKYVQQVDIKSIPERNRQKEDLRKLFDAYKKYLFDYLYISGIFFNDAAIYRHRWHQIANKFGNDNEVAKWVQQDRDNYANFLNSGLKKIKP